MAETLLSAVNRVLKRVSIIEGDAGKLTTLTDKTRQTEIDIAIQAWNEVLGELLRTGVISQEAKEGSISLADSQREYSLPSDFEGFAINKLLNEANGYEIRPYPGGYEAMRNAQLQPANWTGRPLFYAINPENNKLRMDTVPTADDAGLVYRFSYNQRHFLEEDSDTFPISDGAVKYLTEAVKEVWNFERKEKFVRPVYRKSLAMAASVAHQRESRKKY